jgi:hypothetical protein
MPTIPRPIAMNQAVPRPSRDAGAAARAGATGGGGTDIAGGRIESGTGIPAAFVSIARTPLVPARVASAAASSSAAMASAFSGRSEGSLASARMTAASTSFGMSASGHTSVGSLGGVLMWRAMTTTASSS